MMIRTYKPEYQDALIELIQLNTPTYFDKEEEADFKTYLKKGTEDYFVILQNKKPIACGGINYEPKTKTAIISWDIVHPDFQGKGVGKKLLLFRINKIKAMNLYPQIIVRTSQFTFKFYETFGFKLVEYTKDYWAKGIDLYYMVLKLKL